MKRHGTNFKILYFHLKVCEIWPISLKDYSQVPYKRGRGPNRQGVGKIPKCNKRGIKINGGRTAVYAL